MRISDWSSDVCSSDLREFRKPLVVFTPKSLLRHKRCVSDLAAFGPGSCFHRVLYCDDRPSKPKDAKQEIGRASCRARVGQYVSISVVAVSLKKKTTNIKNKTKAKHHITNRQNT